MLCPQTPLANQVQARAALCSAMQCHGLIFVRPRGRQDASDPRCGKFMGPDRLAECYSDSCEQSLNAVEPLDPPRQTGSSGEGRDDERKVAPPALARAPRLPTFPRRPRFPQSYDSNVGLGQRVFVRDLGEGFPDEAWFSALIPECNRCEFDVKFAAGDDGEPLEFISVPTSHIASAVEHEALSVSRAFGF